MGKGNLPKVLQLPSNLEDFEGLAQVTMFLIQPDLKVKCLTKDRHKIHRQQVWPEAKKTAVGETAGSCYHGKRGKEGGRKRGEVIDTDMTKEEAEEVQAWSWPWQERNLLCLWS